jgi:hypothetical protein
MNTKLFRWMMAALACLPLAACGSDPAPAQFPPLTFNYLTPLRVKVGSLDIDAHWVPVGGEPDISTLSPVQPVDALERMAQDRLIAVGTDGRAVFRVEDAGINRIGDQLQGHLGVELDIYTATNTRTAFAEARVARASILTGSGVDALRAGLYDLTKQMMADMNVEFEYQLRHSLHDWLQEGSESGPAVPAPVLQQPLDTGAPTPLAPPMPPPETPGAQPMSPPPGILGTLPQSLLPPPQPNAPQP